MKLQYHMYQELCDKMNELLDEKNRLSDENKTYSILVNSVPMILVRLYFSSMSDTERETWKDYMKKKKGDKNVHVGDRKIIDNEKLSNNN